MNAVEAIEQLGAMGRMLQAREEGLQQPSLRLLALCRTADWEKVLGDPVAALSQLLGAAGGGQAARTESAPEPTDTPLPLAPFRWDADRPLAGSGIPAARGEQSGAPTPPGGMRLARRQTSLLGILNANLEDRGHAGTGEQGSVAALTGVAAITDAAITDAAGLARRDGAPADPHGPAARWSVVPSSFAGDDEMRQSSPQVVLSSGGSQQEDPHYRKSGGGQGAGRDRLDGGPSAAAGVVGSGLTNAGDVTAEMNVWEYESLRRQRHDGIAHPGERQGSDGRQVAAPGPVEGAASGRHQGLAANQEAWPPVVQNVVHSQAGAMERASDWTGGGEQNADVPSAQDTVWTSAHDDQEDRPLSMAQIEQVLAALDERLELGLLRMYGAAGGRA